jgi:hypothetical protein
MDIGELERVGMLGSWNARGAIACRRYGARLDVVTENMEGACVVASTRLLILSVTTRGSSWVERRGGMGASDHHTHSQAPPGDGGQHGRPTH